MNPNTWQDLTAQDIKESLEAAEREKLAELSTPQEVIQSMCTAGRTLRDCVIVVATNAKLEHVAALLDLAFADLKSSLKVATEIARARIKFLNEDDDTDVANLEAEEETNEG